MRVQLPMCLREVNIPPGRSDEMAMRTPVLALSALTLLACLPGSASAQNARSPSTPGKPAPRSDTRSDDAMTDVNPAVLARCREEAARKNLRGEARTLFMRTCVDPEDEGREPTSQSGYLDPGGCGTVAARGPRRWL